MIKVQLGRRNSIWFLLDRKIYLTAGAPGPIELDFDALSIKEKTQVVMDLRNGLIEAPGFNIQDLILRARGLETPRLAADKDGDIVIPQLLNNSSTEARAKELLAIGVQKLRNVLETENDSQLVDAMIRLEAEGKKRKSLLLLLHQAKNRLVWLKSHPQQKSGDPLVRTLESQIEDEWIGNVKIKVGANP